MAFERKKPTIEFKKDQLIDYKDTELLSKCISAQGEMVSRRRTGLDAQGQRELKRAIKRARHLGLLPFVV